MEYKTRDNIWRKIDMKGLPLNERKFFLDMTPNLITAPPAVARRDPAINQWCRDYKGQVEREYQRRMAEIEKHSREVTEVRIKQLLFQLREALDTLRKHDLQFARRHCNENS